MKKFLNRTNTSSVNYKITIVQTGLTTSNMLQFCDYELLIPILSSVIIPLAVCYAP
jgi:hypothetical protein